MKFSTPKSPVSSTTSAPRYRRRRRRIHAPTTTPEDSYEEDVNGTSPSQRYPTEDNLYDDDYVDDDEEDEADDEYEEFSGSSTTNPYTQSKTISQPPESVLSTNRLQPSANCLNCPAATPVLESSSYINIAPLPIFRGDSGECPVAHLSRFARVCRANNALSNDMKRRIFPVTLDGEAVLWYELNVEPYSSLSWEEIQSSFLQMYRRMEFDQQLRSELMEIQQADGETVKSFLMRMQWILKKWPDHGIPDVILKGVFVDGLREDFQDWVIPHNPNSLDDAFRLALTWEQALSIRASRRRRNGVAPAGTPRGDEAAKCGFCEGPHDEGTCEIRQKMRELWLNNKEKSLIALNVGSSSTPEKKDREDEKKDWGVVDCSSSKSQCQCWKHQCWKKKAAVLTRNFSTVD